MEDYGFVVDDLLNGTTSKPVESGEFDYIVDDLLDMKSTPIPLGIEKTGQVSTITTQPITRPSAEAPQPSSFGTMTKAALVEDPQTKIKLYADARGIPADRYSIDKSGEIVFKDDSGQMRFEEQSGGVGGKLKQVAATVAGNPAIPLSTVGAAFGGAPGAVAGAMGGETIRQGIAGLVFDDPQTVKGNLLNLGAEGIVGALSEFGGRGMMKAFNRVMGIGKPEGRLLASAAQRDFSHIQAPEVQRIHNLGQQFGIDLFPPQTTKSKQLIAKMNLLRDLPQTSDIIQAADQIQNEQIQGAIPRFLDRIAPAGATSRDAGEQLSNMAEEAVRGLKRDRAAIAKPIYEAAFQENPVVDISGPLSFLDEKIEFARGDELRALTKLKKDLLGPAKIDEATGEEAVGDATLRGMHGMKTLLDKKINSLGKPNTMGYDHLIGGEMKQVRNLLVESMDQASDGKYKLAREAYALMSPAVNRAEKGLTGVLAKADGDNLTGLSSILLASKNTRPETVAAVKNEILKQQNGETVWNTAVRDYLEHVFDGITDSQVHGITNIGGAFRKKIFGNTKQREILAEALGPQKYGQLNDFMTVLERTGLTFKAESTTAIRQEALADMRQEFGSSVATIATTPFQAPKKLLGDKINEVLFARGSEKLAKALVDDRAAQQLLALKKLPKGSEELIKGLTQFLEMTGVEEIKDEVE